MPAYFNSIHQMSDFADAIKEEFPQEWHPVILFEASQKRGTVQFANYFCIDGVKIRHDFELAIPTLLESNLGWNDIMRVIKDSIDHDIESGRIEEIRKEQDANSN